MVAQHALWTRRGKTSAKPITCSRRRWLPDDHHRRNCRPPELLISKSQPATMADDTRQTQPQQPSSTEAHGANAPPSSSPKYVTAPPPGQAANMMPGGTQHTAGGEKMELTGNSLAQTFKPDDILKVHQQPNAREAFLAGIGSGFGVGGLMAIWGSKFASPPGLKVDI